MLRIHSLVVVAKSTYGWMSDENFKWNDITGQLNAQTFKMRLT